jgi:hypothetical protein
VRSTQKKRKKRIAYNDGVYLRNTGAKKKSSQWSILKQCEEENF